MAGPETKKKKTKSKNKRKPTRDETADVELIDLDAIPPIGCEDEVEGDVEGADTGGDQHITGGGEGEGDDDILRGHRSSLDTDPKFAAQIAELDRQLDEGPNVCVSSGGQDERGQDEGGQDVAAQVGGAHDEREQDEGAQVGGAQDEDLEADPKEGQDEGAQVGGAQDEDLEAEPNEGQDEGGQDWGAQDEDLEAEPNEGQDEGGQGEGGQDGVCARWGCAS